MQPPSRGLIIVKFARVVDQDLRVCLIVFGVMRGHSGIVPIIGADGMQS